MGGIFVFFEPPVDIKTGMAATAPRVIIASYVRSVPK